MLQSRARVCRALALNGPPAAVVTGIALILAYLVKYRVRACVLACVRVCVCVCVVLVR